MANSITDKLKDIARTAAPTIGAMLGGPLGGVAARQLSEFFLGKPDGTEEEIHASLRMATPEQLVELRRIDADLEKSLIEAGFKKEELRYKDIDSARQRQIAVKDLMPGFLGSLIVGGFLGVVWQVVTGDVKGLEDPVKAALIGSVIGYLSAKAEQVVSYYFGSSAGSKQKNEILDNVLKDQGANLNG